MHDNNKKMASQIIPNEKIERINDMKVRLSSKKLFNASGFANLTKQAEYL